MTDYYEVTCITKPNRYSPVERIEEIGGVLSDGRRWKLSEDDAIAAIKQGKWGFYVLQQGRRVNVIISRSAAGREYLKTESDGVYGNNLLSLTSCPI